MKIARNLPPEFGNAKELNNRLTSLLNLIEDIIKYAERRNVPDKGKFVKKYFKPDLDIYSLDDQVKKDDKKKLVEEVEKKKAELDVFHQIDLYILSKGKGTERWVSFAINIVAGVILFALGIWLGPKLTDLLSHNEIKTTQESKK